MDVEDLCIVCRDAVADDDEAMQCDDCSSWQHVNCGSGISRSTYGRLIEEDASIEWKCSLCTEAPSPIPHDTSIEQHDVSIEQHDVSPQVCIYYMYAGRQHLSAATEV